MIVSTRNEHKLRELREALPGIELEPLPEEVELPPETGDTFEDNALLKARHAARAANLPALADDSGIEVDALGGRPGVYSARYAGEPKSDARNNEKVIADLAAHADKSAYYYCVLVYVRHADDPQPVIADGSWHGEIVAEARGSNGFGYDPHFLVPALGKTAAELTPQEKNAVSHRGQALRALVGKLK